QATSGYPHGSAAGWVALLAIVRHPHERRAVRGHAVLATVGLPLADSDRRIRLLVPAGAVLSNRSAWLSGWGRAFSQGFVAVTGRTNLVVLSPFAACPAVHQSTVSGF